ncbi:FAD-dependent oxidoreductase [Sinosporangium siamense]|uniref:FAD-binding domain-containing protein n=1 Tax=Sinosporangium siamense TaxID=1367973 RepID=A0A919RK43_9ACTN|nr:NAD(P)/FAD-dependent oxidoreductase [Sinosporangium siamense]GII95078.1 hypothetical protein Ssi02_53090 [Sinosporangium siamense]
MKTQRTRAGEMYDVLVVGAGPAGLTVAAGLARHGVSCLVVERGEHPPAGAHCLVVQAASAAALTTVGVDVAAIPSSAPLRRRVFHVSRHTETRPLSAPSLVVGHDGMTQLLSAAALRYGAAVETGADVVGVHQVGGLHGDGHVQVRVHSRDHPTLGDSNGAHSTEPRSGRADIRRARWVVVCTGTDDTLTRAMGLDWMPSHPRPVRWLGVNAVVTGVPGLGPEEEHIFHGPHANLGLLPLPTGGHRLFSVAADQARPPRDAGEFEAFVRRITGLPATLSEVGDLWRTRPGSGRAPAARRGRVLTLGAARRRLPLPVQCLNAAIEEAVHLADELAGVVHGRRPHHALEAHAVRHGRAAERLISEAWRMVDYATTPDPEQWLAKPR